MKTVTLSTLVADAGETPRVLNHWTDLGILRPLRSTNRKGRGNRRHYPAEPMFGERKYAVLAAALNRLRLPLNDIKDLIYAYRLTLDPLDKIDYQEKAHVEHAKRIRAELAERAELHPLEAALQGERNVFEVIAAHPDNPERPWHSGYLLQHWNTDLAAKGNNEVMLSVMGGTTSAVVLNLSKIFEPLHLSPAPTDD